MTRRSRRPNDEEGSILLLSLGYALLAIVLILVCVDATSLYLAQKRLESVADAAALAGADGFTLTVEAGEPTADLTDTGVYDQAADIVGAAGTASLVSAGTPDGVSARVTVATVWHPPILTLFVPDGVPLEATATSRNALL
ncbi:MULTISPECIES: pilus assembly protein TadG-related protein [unclassified Microbacterium]|uniref:pilus assembly protein TadG-related protein n=1 Tax=unclassified Microbacterium TaxID=2609290 RepID=UPI00214CF6EA|nr:MULTISPECIES: pilus assembly protein TadG-related protein [unclassified Microbacterium]MCR2784527.1 pilus assembly protein TadG-related protein [Microbacterium sp. zg.B96]MDL5350551.1 pilus assembly protein TadG-related protein [Microbacterium sp. zg-YB36]WIM14662.1 pilus assembly protein TadG-related protein [Microbacterium sp. zg-B96]